jgi:Zn-finger nucleic acid-binding protein
MKCPSCSQILRPVQAGDISLDACKDGCGGVWLDAGEITKFDEPHEFNAHEILTLAELKQGVKVDSGAIKMCPRCPGERLVRQFFDQKNEIEIDQCWSCGGIWFDLGEINAVRKQYQTYAERQQAVNSYVDERLEEHVSTIEQSTKEKIARFNEEHRNRLTAAVYAFKELLGLEG